jgi:hypothetical protein
LRGWTFPDLVPLREWISGLATGLMSKPPSLQSAVRRGANKFGGPG